MVRADRTLAVNGDPAAPRLAREHVWRGLVMKAENPLPFVPVISRCTVVGRGPDWLEREIVDNGDPISERVTFYPQRQVKFVRTSGRVLGTILNEIVEDGRGELQLHFTFALEVEGVASGSAEEHAFASNMERGYLMAVNATLKAMRTLVKEGALNA
jgi:hypothetical protein